ncbi:hypothetical protein N9V91_07960, partial [Acidimicrobiaceae bacterium]|nr:hypothetical protein [Acidimicrobiaceae bacterium]
NARSVDRSCSAWRFGLPRRRDQCTGRGAHKPVADQRTHYHYVDRVHVEALHQGTVSLDELPSTIEKYATRDLTALKIMVDPTGG